MWVFKLSIIAAVVAATAGCAKRVPEPPNLAPGTPHVSWIIMHGDNDNPDREFGCQSDPRNDCEVPASRPDNEVVTAVYVYYHGAGGETKYEGMLDVGFLRGASASHQFKPNITVKKAESITNQSVTGTVTSTPGTYNVSLSLTATVVDTKRTQSIREQIPVSVK